MTSSYIWIWREQPCLSGSAKNYLVKATLLGNYQLYAFSVEIDTENLDISKEALRVDDSHDEY